MTTCVSQLFIIVTKLLRQSKLEREAIHSVSCLWSSQAMVCHSFPSVSIAKQQAHHHGRDHEAEECEAPYVYGVKRGRMELSSHHHFKVMLPETLPPPLVPLYRCLSHHNSTPMMVARPLWHIETNHTTALIRSCWKFLPVYARTGCCTKSFK